MSKRRVGIYFAVALVGVGAIIYFTNSTVSRSRNESRIAVDGAELQPAIESGQEERPKDMQGSGLKAGSRIPAEMPADQALADAHAISRCERAANVDLRLPDDLTEKQRKEFEQSRTAGLDCSVLDSKYSVYELAKYAAEKGNVQAQLDFAGLAASAFNEEQAALNPELIRQYKMDSLRFLNLAASAGSADALLRLSENYRVGLFAEKSAVKAYAYAYAYSQEKPQSSLARLRVNQLASGLTAKELLEGQQLGQTLMKARN